MKVGIYDLNECSLLNYKERMDIYKSVGFTAVGLYLDENYMANGENYVDIITYAKSIGLEVNQVHLDYNISNLISDGASNKYFEYANNKLEECLKLNVPYLVLHASKGENAPLITELGLKKLDTMMRKYKGERVFLCFENVRDNRNLEKIICSNINNIGVCYDLGHAHCYGDEYEILNFFKDRILCTHLHNNFKKDTHNSLLDGEINVKSIIPLLNNANIDNCLEVFPMRGLQMNKEDFVEFVRKNYLDYRDCI